MSAHSEPPRGTPSSNPPGDNGRVFEALWMPRWYGQDPGIAHGQEGELEFRTPVPPSMGPGFLAAALDRPRYAARCRVLGIKHDVLGRLQAIQVEGETYRFVLHTGGVVEVRAGVIVGGLEVPPPDWTARITLEALTP